MTSFYDKFKPLSGTTNVCVHLLKEVKLLKNSLVPQCLTDIRLFPTSYQTHKTLIWLLIIFQKENMPTITNIDLRLYGF